MIEALQGTILDIGPAGWAFIIVFALVLIEVFQLGPHSFGWKKKKNLAATRKGGTSSSRDAGTGGKKAKSGNSGRQRRRKNKFRVLKNKPWSDLILINAPCSILYIVPDKGEFKAEKLVPQIQSSASIKAGTVYPEEVEPGSNYAVAHGEESDVLVLDRFKDLVDASEDIGCVCLFSSVIPSVFALHKLVDLKKESKVELKDAEISVLYEDLDEVDEDPDRLQEKQQFLHQSGVSLERMTLVS